MKLMCSSKGSRLAIASVTTLALAMVSVDAMAGQTFDVGASEEEQIERAAEAYNARQADDSTRVVCGLESQTGTRFKRKVCRTVATMEANERNARYYMRNKKPIIKVDRVTTRH